MAAVVLGGTGVVRYARGGATNRDTAVVGTGWLGLIILVVEASVTLNLPLEPSHYGS